MAYFSLLMVLVSTVTFICSTFEELQLGKDGESRYPLVNITIEAIDQFVIIFFSLEYLVRFICSPRKLKFAIGPMNLVVSQHFQSVCFMFYQIRGSYQTLHLFI